MSRKGKYKIGEKRYQEQWLAKNPNYHKNYQRKNKEKTNISSQKWKDKNRDYVNEYSRKYREENPEKYLEIARKSNNKNRKEISRRETIRKKTDKEFAIKKRLRIILVCALKRYSKTGKIFQSKKYGVDFQAIIKHLKPFPKDISKYHIDHIKPLCTFKLTNPEEVQKAFAPENHQWLTVQENLRKGGRY